jgi:flagellar biogenesis protein FliO
LPLRRGEPAVSDVSAVTVLLVLGLSLGGGLLVALQSGGLRALGARRGRTGRAAIERLSSQMLGKGAAVHAVRWHDEELLIGCTEGQVILLARRQGASGFAEPA